MLCFDRRRQLQWCFSKNGRQLNDVLMGQMQHSLVDGGEKNLVLINFFFVSKEWKMDTFRMFYHKFGRERADANPHVFFDASIILTKCQILYCIFHNLAIRGWICLTHEFVNDHTSFGLFQKSFCKSGMLRLPLMIHAEKS